MSRKEDFTGKSCFMKLVDVSFIDSLEIGSLLKSGQVDKFILETRAEVECEIAEWREYEENTNPDDRTYSRLGEHVRLGVRIMCITPHQLSNILFECFGVCSQLKYATLAKILDNCDEINKFPYVFQVKDFIRIWDKDFPILTDLDMYLGTLGDRDTEREDKIKLDIVHKLGYDWDLRDLISYRFWEDLLIKKGLKDWDND